jgi:hypothetical protein
MTHPVTTSSQTPTAHGMPGPKPEPSSGVDGKNITRQPINATAPTTTLKDQPPTTTAATGTHLAAPP